MKFILTLETFDGSLNAYADTETQARVLAHLLKENDSVFVVRVHEWKKGILGKQILKLKNA